MIRIAAPHPQGALYSCPPPPLHDLPSFLTFDGRRLTASLTLDNIKIRRCSVLSGPLITVTSDDLGAWRLTIENSEFSDNSMGAVAMIFVQGGGNNSRISITLRSCKFYRNTGINTVGMQMMSVDSPQVDNRITSSEFVNNTG